MAEATSQWLASARGTTNFQTNITKFVTRYPVIS
jgi:hypothetical protein